ncbi:hypothetical protein, partial [Bacteroides sp.]
MFLPLFAVYLVSDCFLFWFPAAGYWHFGNGVLTGVSAYGNYWSSSPFALGTSTAGHLGFGSGS